MSLTKADIQDLKKQGYTEAQIQKALQEIELDSLNNSYNSYENNISQDPRQNSRVSAFSTNGNEDIIRWQLELNDILERAEHILRGDIPMFKNGHVIWQKIKNPKTNTLNEQGVQETMKILSLYVNRNTILSDYTNDEIRFKVYDFGREINNLYFMRYEEFGLDTEEKRKSYPIIIREMVDIVHSAYKRALLGGERRSLREMINVSQSTQTQLGQMGDFNNSLQQKERGLLNPLRFIKGKYV